jgi:hypothetical protein
MTKMSMHSLLVAQLRWHSLLELHLPKQRASL